MIQCQEALQKYCLFYMQSILGDKNSKLKQLLEESTELISKMIFEDLATCALRSLSLPTSNAVVRRIFSIMNAVKNKLRNIMSISMLVGIIRISSFLSVRKIYCHNFQPTSQTIIINILTLLEF